MSPLLILQCFHVEKEIRIPKWKILYKNIFHSWFEWISFYIFMLYHKCNLIRKNWDVADERVPTEGGMILKVPYRLQTNISSIFQFLQTEIQIYVIVCPGTGLTIEEARVLCSFSDNKMQILLWAVTRASNFVYFYLNYFKFLIFCHRKYY